MTADDAIEAFRLRFVVGRTIDRVDVEERVALALDERIVVPDVRVLDVDGLVRLFVCTGYDSKQTPPAAIWRSRYVWDVSRVDEILRALSIPVTSSSPKKRFTEAA